MVRMKKNRAIQHGKSGEKIEKNQLRGGDNRKKTFDEGRKKGLEYYFVRAGEG